MIPAKKEKEFKDLSLGEKTELLFELREEKDSLNEELKEVRKQIDELQYNIIEEMEDQGLEKHSTHRGTISLSVKLYPNVIDKQEFINWCVDNGHYGMIVARANEASFREFFEENFEYPQGTDAYEKPTLNVRRRS